MAVIAAILVSVAIIMVERKHFARLFKHDKTAFFISILVSLITIYEDPMAGILIGTALSLLLFIENLAQGHYEITNAEDEMYALHPSAPSMMDPTILIYAIKGKLIYINSLAHISRFENDFHTYTTVILELHDVYFIDLDGIDAFDAIVDIIQAKKQKVLIAGVNRSLKSSLMKSSEQFKKLKMEGLIFPAITDALRYANRLK
jgi:SulP family sulfate permease